jgi:uncharacterized membrane protein YoaK (UPF0700 family)
MGVHTTGEAAKRTVELLRTFDPIVPLLLLMSATTGLVDAASVLGLGKVFTANMTGNIVFLGFAAVNTPGFRFAPHAIALAGFIGGAIIAGRIGKFHTGRSRRRWLLTAAAIEATLLWIAALLATAFDAARQSPDFLLLVIIVLAALAMGFRNATIRQLKIPDLTTTVLTMTVTGLFADLQIAGGSNQNWRRRVSSVVAIFAGAAAGAAMVNTAGLSVPLALAGLLVTMGAVGYALHAHPSP